MTGNNEPEYVPAVPAFIARILTLEKKKEVQERGGEKMMEREKATDKEQETALVFAATMIMQQVCDNPKLSIPQCAKLRKWAEILSDLADEKTDKELN